MYISFTNRLFLNQWSRKVLQGIHNQTSLGNIVFYICIHTERTQYFFRCLIIPLILPGKRDYFSGKDSEQASNTACLILEHAPLLQSKVVMGWFTFLSLIFLLAVLESVLISFFFLRPIFTPLTSLRLFLIGCKLYAGLN